MPLSEAPRLQQSSNRYTPLTRPQGKRCCSYHVRIYIQVRNLLSAFFRKEGTLARSTALQTTPKVHSHGTDKEIEFPFGSTSIIAELRFRPVIQCNTYIVKGGSTMTGQAGLRLGKIIYKQPPPLLRQRQSRCHVPSGRM